MQTVTGRTDQTDGARAFTAQSSSELNVRLFYAYRALIYCFLWMPVWFIYLQRMRGLTITQVSIIGAVGWLAAALAQVPTGLLADVLGRRVALALGALAYGIGVFGYALATNFWIIMLFDALWTVGFSFMAGADLALVYDSLRQDGREDEYTKIAGRATAVVHGAQGLGSLAGAPLALFALNLPLLLSGGLAALACIVALQLRDPPLIRRPQRPEAPRRYIATLANSWEVLQSGLDLRHLLAYYAVVYLPPFLLAYIFLQPYAVSLRVPVEWLGALVFGVRLISLAGAGSAHLLVKWIGERRLLYALPAAMAASCLLMAIMRSVGSLLLLGVIQWLGAMSVPFVTAMLNRRIPSDTRATVLSVAAFINTLGVAIAQPLFGIAIDRWGFGTMLGGLGAVMAALIGSVLAFWHPSDEHA